MYPTNFIFTETSLEYVSSNDSEHECFDICSTWNYLAFAADNILNLNGFVKDKINENDRITFECNIKKISCSEKYCLVLLTSGILYKVEISSLTTIELNSIMLSSEPVRKKKSIFGESFVGSNLNRNSNEIITHIASGRTMSIALSNSNVLYNIPSNIFTFPLHVKVKKICCGNEHCLILTTNGDIYAFGSSS